MQGPNTKCDNCGRECQKGELKPLAQVHHLATRLDAGAEVPAGECIPCGAFAYFTQGTAPGGVYEVRAVWYTDDGAESVSAENPPWQEAVGRPDGFPDEYGVYERQKDGTQRLVKDCGSMAGALDMARWLEERSYPHA